MSACRPRSCTLTPLSCSVKSLTCVQMIVPQRVRTTASNACVTRSSGGMPVGDFRNESIHNTGSADHVLPGGGSCFFQVVVESTIDGFRKRDNTRDWVGPQFC